MTSAPVPKLLRFLRPETMQLINFMKSTRIYLNQLKHLKDLKNHLTHLTKKNASQYNKGNYNICQEEGRLSK